MASGGPPLGWLGGESTDFLALVASYLACELQLEEWNQLFLTPNVFSLPTKDIADLDKYWELFQHIDVYQPILLNEPIFSEFVQRLPVKLHSRAFPLFFLASRKVRLRELEKHSNWNSYLGLGNLSEPDYQAFQRAFDYIRAVNAHDSWLVVLQSLKTNLPQLSASKISPTNVTPIAFFENSLIQEIREVLGDPSYAPVTDAKQAFLILRYGGCHAADLLKICLQKSRPSAKLCQLLQMTPRLVAAPVSVCLELFPHCMSVSLPDALGQALERIHRVCPQHLQEGLDYHTGLANLSIILGTRHEEEWKSREGWHLKPDIVYRIQEFRTNANMRPNAREIVQLFLEAL